MLMFQNLLVKVLQNILSIVKVSRPKGWRAYLWMSFLGYIDGAKNFVFDTLFIYALISYLATAFAVNNLFDIKSDSLNKAKSNPLVSGYCKKIHVYALLVNQAIALLLLLLLKREVFSMYLALCFLGIAYSVPPLRLKGKPLLDVLSHTLFFGALLYLYGFFYTKAALQSSYWYKVALIMLYSAFLQLRNLRDDVEYDMCAGDRTTFVVFPNASRIVLNSLGVIIPFLCVLVFLGLTNYILEGIFLITVVSAVIGYKWGWDRFVDSFVVASLSLHSLYVLLTTV